MTDLYNPILATLAESVSDLEASRKAMANRLRALTSTKPDKDGLTRAFGLPLDHPSVVALQFSFTTLETAEKAAVKALEKELRNHPLWPWIKAQNGLGDKTIARLLAAIGDPYWNDLHNRPRTIGELFSFCGVAGPGQRKRKGERVTWSPEARMRIHVIIDPIIKNRRSPYRAVYDAGRDRYADHLHTETCVRCGPAGKPAPVGSPWPLAHQHAAALRLVKREVLRDLWAAAKQWHDGDNSLSVAA